ncbi:Eco57I restriction-modification methylase domain-containing protein [Bavariicoccus seileri]|uniref:Eco57I restriction-modification methylase domain-containing protein n=1 Tax=Bavariicoccus seileri TaxID=549685 RepID=UPI0003FA3865|nr:Eco57I restriction-modification methylase domain-containing protein [Bavariicoccus seileri]
MSLVANRSYTTNFEFLLLDWDLKQKYYDRAKYIEDFYIQGDFEKAIEQANKFEDELVSKNLVAEPLTNFSYDDLQKDALNRLQVLHQSLKQISINSGHDVKNDFENPEVTELYQTNERKIVYVQTADNSTGNWSVYSGSEKIGDTTADNSLNPFDFQPNSEYLKSQADSRISSYMTTSGVPYKIDWVELAFRPGDNLNPWFRDQDVHEVLKRSGYKKNKAVKGNEWWKVSLEVAKKAIEAAKENREVIDGPVIDKSKIILRPEQKAAVNQTRQVFKTKNRMLWNAKMRFGKTLSAYQLIKDEGYKSVLILTHRPVVSDSWYDDFTKLEMEKAGYRYGSKKGESIHSLISNNEKFVYFASIQDLRGSEQVGGKQGEKNELVFSTDWDLIVFDEAHEGTQTELAQNVEKAVAKENTKILELSGTPFNILDQYSEEQVFTWDYVMEQEAKLRWSVEKPELPNPYESLPKVNMFTFEMGNKEKYSDSNKAFNFKEFFRVKENGSFEHESDVYGFLNEIVKESKTNYPFSTKKYRNELRHSLWLLPGISAAKALKELMEKHPIFGKEYKIIDVVGKDDDEITKHDPDLIRVRNAISDKPWETKTITLTVRKLTTGVNVKEWTAVVFLNNTNSAMNYLQAAFRAQTPYSNEVQGQKKNAYIFDFAPDRALTVMAESASINSGVGKRNTQEQKDKMDKMLNFLPIIGMTGNKMKSFSVDRMLTQLKKVYAEKAVRSGFDDDSLYSDALLTINPEAAELFEKLRGIVGKTGASKGAKKVNVNEQGLTDEEYERAEKAKKKAKRQRTPEEQAAIDQQNQAKKERRNAISILRGISIRIPLMIFGMEVDIAKDIDIDTFVNEVDEVSWKEFMPAGATKALFKEQAKYYDPEVFIEAGRIIRSRAKSYDDLNYTERAEKIAMLIGTFKNPDKETVLTPWRVVNMQLVSTIGGLSFYDKNFISTIIDGSPALNWVTKADTDDAYKSDSKFLEINSKTGLYPLFIATSLFYKRQMQFVEDNAGKITKNDEDNIIQKILKKNVYVIAKTPMAKTITKRTLVGYKDIETNIRYIPNIVKTMRKNVDIVVKKVQEAFGVMKFDVVVGNPPYQENDNGKRDDGSSNASASPLYNLFTDLAKAVSDVQTLIMPTRWTSGAGKGLGNFTKEMLSDRHIRVFEMFTKSDMVFPNTDIKGGVGYFLRDNKYSGPAKITVNAVDNEVSTRVDYLDAENLGLFIPFTDLKSIFKKVKAVASNLEVENMQKIVSVLKPYGLRTDFFSNQVKYGLPPVATKRGAATDIEIIGLYKKKRVSRFIPREYPIPLGKETIDKYKVFISYAYGSGNLARQVKFQRRLFCA